MSRRPAARAATKSSRSATSSGASQRARVPVIRSAWRVLLVLFAGSLWSLAAWVALTIFDTLGNAGLAGAVAARLFSIETYLGLGVAALALLLPARRRLGGLYLAAVLLACNEWALKPGMTAAHAHGSALGLSFGAWHGIAGGIYLIACLAMLMVVWNERYR